MLWSDTGLTREGETMSDTLVDNPAVVESGAAAQPSSTRFGRNAIVGIVVGAVIVVGAAFGGGVLVGSGINASSLGSSNTSQRGPGGPGGFAPNGTQGGPPGASTQGGTAVQNG
jgi:hypothetical protein